MVGARLTSPVVLALAIAACAPSDDEGEKYAPNPTSPGISELAVSQESRLSNSAAGPTDHAVEQFDVVNLTAKELANRLEAGNIMLVDVRTEDEVARGMIPGAINIPMDEFTPGPALLEQADGRDIVLYCRSGRRSGMAARALSDFLGQPVEHLAGGIVAWQDAGLLTTGL